MISKKVFSVNMNSNFILDSTVNTIKDANIFLIKSPGPVSPELFDEDPIVQYTGLNPIEDLNHISQINKALNTPNIKLIICVDKAALLACALAGGKLIQDVNNHNIQGLHRIKGSRGEFLVPSNHTQMMCLSDMNSKDYDLLMWSLVKSDAYKGVNIPNLSPETFKEPEFVLFKNFNKPVLAIMPDVSRMRLNTRTVRVTNQLINKYLNE